MTRNHAGRWLTLGSLLFRELQLSRLMQIDQAACHWGGIPPQRPVGNYSLRLSYAQCSNACRWTGLQEESPLVQFLLI